MATAVLEHDCRAPAPNAGPLLFDVVDRLPALVVGCHPGRHVARVIWKDGPASTSAYLKRERRVSWKARLTNWWAGFGFVSKSVREARLLGELRRAGIACPEVIAVGEDRRRGAFLVVRALADYVDLRSYLRSHLPHEVAGRRRFAHALGAALARIHAAGFDHPDLYSKHVLVHPASQEIAILDWQRSRRRRRLSGRRRCRDLAALHATLGAALASKGDRLACLRSYLTAGTGRGSAFKTMAWRILGHSARLRRKRRIRELCQGPLPEGAQVLVPLAGNTIYVAPALQEHLSPRLRSLLCFAGIPSGTSQWVERLAVRLPGGGRATLVRRRVHRPHGWFWSWLRGRSRLSPERQQADIIYRLERYGVPVPRLLAYGQRQAFPWRQESVLLTYTHENTVPLELWMRTCQGKDERGRIVQEVARLLRRMHDAGCYLGSAVVAESAFRIQGGRAEPARVLLGSVEGLVVRRSPSPRLAAAAFATLREWTERANQTVALEQPLLPCGAEA